MSEAEAEIEDEPTFGPGSSVAGRFVIEDVLGSGATGTVYRARRSEDDLVVALKVVHAHLCGNRQIFGRYRREAKILSHLEGDHIARLLEVVEHEGLMAIALEHVDGESLESALSRRGPLPENEAVEIALQVCRALGTAHARGVVHRDLKPGNVLLEKRRSEGITEWKRVRVVDFGLAKIVQDDLGSTGLTEQDMIFGTAEYMSPEQARGDDADGRADLYAVGIMLYEMLVGRVPLSGPTPIATMTAHLTEEPAPPSSAAPERGIPPPLDDVVLKALAKSPADRFATARALAEALVECCAHRRRTEEGGAVGSSSPPRQPLARPALPRVRSPVELGTDDTDLHLEHHLEHSATMPADEPLESAPPRSRSSTPRPPSISLPAPSSTTGFALSFAMAALVAIAIGAYLAMR